MGVGVVVVGQVGRDLVVRAHGLPPAGGATGVPGYWEGLGGKGANQAVGLAQLGVPVALVGVAGTDAAGDSAVRRAGADGIDLAGVVRRGSTALLVDLVDRPGSRRLFEHVPDEALLTAADVEHARDLLARADTVSVQLQQPPDAVLAAARIARAAGARVVADGGAEPDLRDELLPLVHVLRADADETEQFYGEPATSVDAAEAVGRRLLAAGPELVAIAVPEVGDLLVWSAGTELLRFAEVPVLDPTGAGDAFVAGLITGLRRGDDAARAGRLASAAASSTVQRLGGRPDLHALRRDPPG